MPPQKEVSIAEMCPEIEIIVGTYEEYLLGYQIVEEEVKDENKLLLKQTFADKSHAGAIKCISVQGPWVASGGSDDRIFVYDMRQRKLSQVLLSHSGTINALSFAPDMSHLLSGSSDGQLKATRVGSWAVAGDWKKAHAGTPITHISCHPSSKLCLSLGGDRILNTWNLVKGRVVYRTNLKSKTTLGAAPDCLSWSTDGEHFTLTGLQVLEIWDIKTANVARRAKTPSRPICVAWLDETECLSGLENGSLAWISLADHKEAEPKILPAHAARVKAVACLNNTLVSVSSAGEIKVWRSDLEKRELTFIASTSIGCRPTSLGLVDLSLIEGGAARPKQSPAVPVPTSRPLEVESDLQIDAPKGFVTIEFDDDAKPPATTPKKAAKKQQKSAKKQKKAEMDFDENSSDGESDAITDSESDDENDSLPAPTPKKVTKKSGKQEEDSNAESSEDTEATVPKPKARKGKAEQNSDSDSAPKRKRKQPASHTPVKRKVKKQTR
ncbi:p21-activated protein kinase-interacting protein 1-like [Drosophila guanche]|uniref:Blast:p21-activated protein kinase-interacting protein 1-like n=1 Tax=Drosophila guanche TaxID=7266 RepID=A0A3B0J832_DROGU|nr:p21-activated protein kinase-interacting protein 1-like [Drosophila guanche]SPP78307.1 blast:p21-activated protein kinase-interacting protein 1-like [Drosophila guanche]